MKHKKIVSVIEREFLEQEGHDDDPLTFVRITNLALCDSQYAKQQLTQRMIDKYFVENWTCCLGNLTTRRNQKRQTTSGCPS